MKHINLSKKTIWGGLLLLGTAAVLVACGGASQEDESWKEDPRVIQAMKPGLSFPVSWGLSTLEFGMTPGTRKEVPLTLTTTKALKNARVIFVPDLRNAVTVTPATIPALEAGQSATVTLSFAPSATDTRKLLAGVVLLFDQNATVSKPLVVKVNLEQPTYVDASSGLSVTYPALGANSTLTASVDERDGANGRATYDISLVAPTGESGIAYRLSVEPNAFSHPDIASWFADRVDASGQLLLHKTYTPKTLANNAQALVLTGQTPETYEGGSLQPLFAMTADRRHVITVVLPSNHDIHRALGVDSASLLRTLEVMVGSVKIP